MLSIEELQSDSEDGCDTAHRSRQATNVFGLVSLSLPSSLPSLSLSLSLSPLSLSLALVIYIHAHTPFPQARLVISKFVEISLCRKS